MAIALMKMFWKSMYMPSKINTILEKEDVTLEDVLSEEDVVDECKSGNSKLLDFLTKEENLEKLVNMLVDEPDSELDDRFKYKNAHRACEILTSDTTQITDALSDRANLLSKIYSFFDHDPPINPLQASFFSKTMGLLITHKSEKMLVFFKSQPNFTDRLIDHLDISAIADLLLRLITCIESIQCRNHCFQWLNEQQLVQRLVSLINIDKSNEVHSNASQSLCDIIRLSREHQHQHRQQHHSVMDGTDGVVVPDDVLLQTIESVDTVNDLLNRALTSDPSKTNESLITNTIIILQTLLEPRKTSTTIFSIVEDAVISESDDDNKENNTMTCNNNNSGNEVVERIVSCIVSRLQDFFNILNVMPKQRYNPMPSTLGLLDPPLGPSRLAVIRFFNALLGLRNQSVEDKLAEIDAPSKILSLFLSYPWNNFLHGEVEKFVFHAFNSTSSPNHLLDKLLNECQLVEKLCQELEKHCKQRELTDDESSVRPRRPGYLGHMTSIANLLVSKFNSSPDLLQALSAETQSLWNDFTSTTLPDINKINNTDLGVGINNGRGHLSSSEDEEDDDEFNLMQPHDELQKEFNNYQAQTLTTDFADCFGFTEDDFNDTEELIGSPFKDRISSLDFNLDSVEDSPIAAASFHQACQDRIQQFDESQDDDEEEGEEPMWPVLRKPRLNLMAAMDKEAELSKKNGLAFSKEKDEEFDDGDDDDDDDEYRNDGLQENEDSEDDLDSPAIIRQTGVREATTKPDSASELSINGENHESDDDYESLQQADTSILDSSFVGNEEEEEDDADDKVGDDDDRDKSGRGDELGRGDGRPEVKMNGMLHGGDGSLPAEVTMKVTRVDARGDADDLGSAVDIEVPRT